MSSSQWLQIALALTVTVLALLVIILRSALRTWARRYRNRKAVKKRNENRPVRFCRECGAPYKLGDAYCPGCKTLLLARGYITPEENAARQQNPFWSVDEFKRSPVCSNCGARGASKDSYCEMCGQKFDKNEKS